MWQGKQIAQSHKTSSANMEGKLSGCPILIPQPQFLKSQTQGLTHGKQYLQLSPTSPDTCLVFESKFLPNCV